MVTLLYQFYMGLQNRNDQNNFRPCIKNVINELRETNKRKQKIQTQTGFDSIIILKTSSIKLGRNKLGEKYTKKNTSKEHSRKLQM